MQLMTNQRQQSGQALVAGIILILIGAAAFVVFFSRAQLTVTKQQLNSAADAAAYSAAAWRARTLNFDAYANRAIIAQEVAVAQAVTLTGWARYFEETTENIDDILQFIPFVNIVSGAVKQEAQIASQLAQWASAIEIPARAAAGYGYKFLLESSQSVFSASANTFALGTIAYEVAKANDDRFRAFVLAEPLSFTDSRKRYSSTDEKGRLLDLVNRSLDPFTAGPRNTSFAPPGLKKICAPTIEKRGGTTMTHDLTRWESVDLVSIHGSPPPLPLIGCRYKEKIPVGWGAAESSESNNQNQATTDQFNVNQNGMAKSSTSDATVSDSNYGGFSSAVDLDYAALSNKRFPTFDLSVLAYVDGNKLRTADTLNVGVGRLRTTDEWADIPGKGSAKGMARLSTAQVYFRKPTQSATGAPEVGEYASLYSPYWQARLTEPTLAQRAAAMAYAQ
jgi:hypothetical protein